jgi:type II secretion system protein J
MDHSPAIPRIRRRTRGPAGFTLLELLLALMVSVTIAAALATTLYTAFRARSSAEAAVSAARVLDAIGDVMVRDFQNALPPTGVLASAFIGDAVSVELYRSGSEDGAAVPAGIRRVNYQLSDSEGPAGAALLRRVTSNLLAPIENEPLEQRVCRGVRELDIAYFDGANWSDAWDSTQQDNRLPVAVRITLTLSQQDGPGASVSRLVAIPCGITEALALAGGSQ